MIVSTSAEQIDTRSLVWFDADERHTRDGDCPPIEMYPIFNAIQHGTTIPLAAIPSPTRLADLNVATVGKMVRQRLSLTLLTTPETASRAESDFRAWVASSPSQAIERTRQRFEATDDDVAVVLQVFDLRRP